MRVEVTKILDDMGIPYHSGGRDNVLIKCLNPNHDDKRPSMYVHRESGLIHCFSCHYKGHILQLVRATHNFNQLELIKYVQQFQIGGTTEEEVTNTLMQMFYSRTSSGAVVPKPIDMAPEHIAVTEHPYLTKRGFTPEEIAYWHIGKCTKYPYTNWVYIPIFYNRILRNYFLRCDTDTIKLYGPYPRKDILFGYDSAKDYTKPIYVCEGIFDMIYLRRLRVQAVAILSNHVSQEQLDILKLYKEINIVPDIDKNLRGMQSVHDIFSLVHNTDIFVLELPNNKKDPAECTLEELVQADFYKIPIIQYVLRDRYQAFYRTIPKKKKR